MFNVSVNDVVYDGPKGTEERRLSRTRRQLLSLPLFASFLRNHADTVSNQSNSKFTNGHSKWQGQIFAVNSQVSSLKKCRTKTPFAWFRRRK